MSLAAYCTFKLAPQGEPPCVSPWPDVKTDDPNYTAYIWVREGGWSDGKFTQMQVFHALPVAAFTYRAAEFPGCFWCFFVLRMYIRFTFTARFCGLLGMVSSIHQGGILQEPSRW